MPGDNPYQVSHPPHMKSTWSSAFIPFCAFKGDLNVSKNPMSLLHYPFCSSFVPTLLDGQLCYQLKLNKKSGQGKKNQLMLLLDYNEDRSLQTASFQKEDSLSPSMMNLGGDVDNSHGVAAKVQIHTLSPYIGVGGGSYKMTAVKRMSATTDFLKMSEADRSCQVELYESCRKRKLLEKCKCVPWEIPRSQVGVTNTPAKFLKKSFRWIENR